MHKLPPPLRDSKRDQQKAHVVQDIGFPPRDRARQMKELNSTSNGAMISKAKSASTPRNDQRMTTNTATRATPPSTNSSTMPAKGTKLYPPEATSKTTTINVDRGTRIRRSMSSNRSVCTSASSVVTEQDSILLDTLATKITLRHNAPAKSFSDSNLRTKLHDALGPTLESVAEMGSQNPYRSRAQLQTSPIKITHVVFKNNFHGNSSHPMKDEENTRNKGGATSSKQSYPVYQSQQASSSNIKKRF